MIDTLRETGDLLELNARLDRIPTAERGPRVWQALESCATDRLWRLFADQEPARIFGWVLALWDEVMRQPWPEDSAFPAQFTERVATMAAADAPRRLRPWHDRLRQTGDALAAEPGRFPHAKSSRPNGHASRLGLAGAANSPGIPSSWRRCWFRDEPCN